MSKAAQEYGNLLGAIKNSELEKVKQFVPKKFSVDALPEKFVGLTPLQQAAKTSNFEVFEYILGHSKQIDAEDQLGHNLFFYVREPDAAKKLQSLKDKKLDINHKNKAGNTPLVDYILRQKDVKTKDVNVVKALIGAGANLDIHSSQGKTLLQLAEEQGWKELAELLPAKKEVAPSEPEKQEIKSEPVKSEQKEEKKSEPNTSEPAPKDYSIKVQLGSTEKYKEKVRKILSLFPLKNDYTLFGKLEQMKNILKEGVDVSEADKNGDTLLHIFPRYGLCLEADAFPLWFSAAPNKYFDVPNKVGMTPFHYIVRAGNAELVDWVLSKGVDVHAKTKPDYKDFPSCSALHIAVKMVSKGGSDTQLQPFQKIITSLLKWR